VSEDGGLHGQKVCSDGLHQMECGTSIGFVATTSTPSDNRPTTVFQVKKQSNGNHEFDEISGSGVAENILVILFRRYVLCYCD